MERFDGKSVLVIDDEFAFVESLSEILAWEGLAVLTAPNGSEGLRILESERPNWVIVDFMMPTMNGEEFCNRVRALEWTKTLPIVLMSAAMIPQPSGAPSNWNVFLRKPFKIADLLQALEDARRAVLS